MDPIEKFNSIEKMTQELLFRAIGPMLAADMSESAVVRKCEEVSREYHERMIARAKAEGLLDDGPVCQARGEHCQGVPDSLGNVYCVDCGELMREGPR